MPAFRFCVDGKHFERVVTRMDTLKSGWTHYVYYTTIHDKSHKIEQKTEENST